MADVESIEKILDELLDRLSSLGGSSRTSMPSDRLIRAECPDVQVVRHVHWRQGTLTRLEEPPSRRPDIRVSVRSDDLERLADGRLSVGTAYLERRLRIDASLADLLRLRAAL